MNAMEMLRESRGACPCQDCDADRQIILDTYAHELAEKIRAEADEMDGWPEEQRVARKYADLIDPNVKQER